MRKRVLAMALAILAFFIFVGSPFQQSANAVALIDDALIAVIIAALAAMGITFVASSSYNSLSEYVSSLLEDYATSRNVTFNDLFAGVQSGANTLGQLLLNNRFVQLIQGFGEYLKIRFNLVDNATVNTVTPEITVGNFISYALPFEAHRPKPSLNDGQMYNTIVASDDAYAILYYYDSTTVSAVIVSAVDCYVQLYDVSSSGVQTAVGAAQQLTFIENYNLYFKDGWTAWTTYQSNSNGYDFSGYTIYNSYQTVINGLIENSDFNQGNMSVVINTGDITLPEDNPDYSDGKGAILDVGADWGDTYPQITDNDIPLDWAPGQAGDTTITYDDAEAVQDQVETGSNTQYVSSNASEYQTTGLQSVFPFCIPFDIYAFFECLAADPVAPSFTWRFYIPRICDEEIEIDLAAFDSAARILRTMELLLFIVGLAFVTRDKFLRG